MRTWIESVALLVCSFVFGVCLAGIVYGAEIATRQLPVSSWTWGEVVV